MKLLLEVTPEQLDALRKALRVSEREYDKIQVRPDAANQHTKDVLYARKFLDLPMHSCPDVIFDHPEALDRDEYL